ncbi:MAG: glycerate kinase [Dehalococcoidia bacterium]|nr:glycerate kinase [Dehalococcoidia bacterium]
MHVLVAPQELKGSLAANEAAAAIARGLRRARPAWTLDLLPLSDGGPGFLAALSAALRGDVRALVCHDPLGRKLVGRYAWIGATDTCVVEAAGANGLWLVAPGECDAVHADTFGVGELIAAAVLDDPKRLLVGVGGSATTDGGAGMARALGARFLDAAGAELGPGGGALARLDRIEWMPPAWVGSVDVVVATDVTNPLTGPDGAAPVYGPQKGASPADVELLSGALERYAEVVVRDLGVDIAAMPGAGAAGGLAAGLVAFLGARIVSGFDVVAEATGLGERLARAGIVVTGEGSFDSQSRRGKVTGRLVELAEASGTPWVLFAGRSDVRDDRVHTLSAYTADPAIAMRDAPELLARAAANWAETQPA